MIVFVIWFAPFNFLWGIWFELSNLIYIAFMIPSHPWLSWIFVNFPLTYASAYCSGLAFLTKFLSWPTRIPAITWQKNKRSGAPNSRSCFAIAFVYIFKSRQMNWIEQYEETLLLLWIICKISGSYVACLNPNKLGRIHTRRSFKLQHLSCHAVIFDTRRLSFYLRY